MVFALMHTVKQVEPQWCLSDLMLAGSLSKCKSCSNCNGINSTVLPTLFVLRRAHPAVKMKKLTLSVSLPHRVNCTHCVQNWNRQVHVNSKICFCSLASLRALWKLLVHEGQHISVIEAIHWVIYLHYSLMEWIVHHIHCVQNWTYQLFCSLWKLLVHKGHHYFRYNVPSVIAYCSVP